MTTVLNGGYSFTLRGLAMNNQTYFLPTSYDQKKKCVKKQGGVYMQDN